jgi:serine/threonine-protein phosphatase 4 regulatory subunit 1
MKRADDVNTGDPTTPLYLSAENFQEEDDETEWVTGLFGRNERDMFRTEILQQVVIGMGRLDMDVDDQCDLDDLSREYQQQTNDEAVTINGGETSREQSEMGKIKENDFVNPYFPLLASPFSVVSPPRSAVSQASTSLSPSSLSSLDPPQPSIVEPTPQNHPDEDITLQDDWMPSAPRPSYRTLPPPRDSTPWSSPDMSDVAHLESSSDSATDSRHFYLEEFGSYGVYNLHEGSQNPYLYGSEEGESDEQAAVGRLSSMSLIAAVAASGLFGVFIFLVPIPHLYRRLSW